MQKNNVLVKGVLLAATAFMMTVVSGGQDAQASAIPGSDITIDYGAQQIKIKETNRQDNEITYGIATVEKVSKTVNKVKVTKKVMTVSTWNYADYKDNMSIDLSNLNRSRANYIQIYGDKNEDPVIICIPPVLSTIKAVFDPLEAKVTIENTKTGSPITGNLEYRTAYSNWINYTSDTDMSGYQVNGSTLYFRIKATAEQSIVNYTANQDNMIYAKFGDEDPLSIYTVGQFPGKELKVAIGKLANAPGASIDYINRFFKIPRNTEYRINTSAGVGEWTDPGTTTAFSLDASPYINQEGRFECRVKKNSKNPASKIKQIKYNRSNAIDLKNSTVTSASAIATADAKESYILDDETGSQKIIYVDNYYKASGTYKGIRLLNTSSNVAYQAYVIPNGKSDDYVPTKITDVKVGTVRNGIVIPTVTLLSASEGDTICIRRRGNGTKKIWSSPYEKFGTVKFPIKQ